MRLFTVPSGSLKVVHDLLVAQALDVPKDDGLAELFRKTRESLEKHFPLVPDLDAPVRIEFARRELLELDLVLDEHLPLPAPAPIVIDAAMSQPPPGSLGMPFVGETLTFLKDPFTFTLSRTKQRGPIWKTRILADTVVFFAGPEAFSFFMDASNFTRENGSPKFLQELLHPDAVPFIDGERHKTRKRLLLTAFTDAALESYLPGIFTVFRRFVDKWTGEGEKAVAGDLSQIGFDIADVLFAASDPGTSNVETARDFLIMNKGAFAPPINLPFTTYGQAIRARDRLRLYIKKQVAKDGDGSALGVLKRARGPNGEQLSTAELEVELLHFFVAAYGGLTASFAWILRTVLGEHPELAAKLRAEADAKLAAGAAPTLDQVRSLDLARAASREVLRS